VRERAFLRFRDSRRWGYVAVLSLLAILASGCLSTKSYVDPGLGHLAYSELSKASSPAPVHLVVEFQTRGKKNLAATSSTY
jgi:hypothetical protein